MTLGPEEQKPGDGGGMRPGRVTLTVLLLLGLALALRLWGIDFGLPYIYHTDEGFEVHRALKLGAGVFDLERIGKGGYYYLLFVLYGIYYVVGRIGGVFAGSEEFLFSYFDDPTPFWLIGRFTTAIIGVVNCYLLYQLGRRTHSTAAGLFAGLLMAVNVLHVQSSHYIAVDVPLTTLVTFSLLLMHWKPLDQPASTVRYGLIGATIALATATKLPGALLLLPALLFHYNQTCIDGAGVVRDWLMSRRLWTLLGTGAVSYIALEPGIVVYLGSVVSSIASFFTPSGEAGSEANWPFAMRSESTLVFYLRALVPTRYLFLLVPFLIGVALSLRRGPLRRHLGLVFAIPYLMALIASQRPEMVFARYVLPLTPVLWLYAGWGIAEIWRVAAARGRSVRMGVAATAAILCVGPMTIDTVQYDVRRTWPDTRTAAKEWIEAHVPAGAVIHIGGAIVRPSTLTAPLRISPDLVDRLVAQSAGGAPEGAGAPKDVFYEIYKRYLRTQNTYHLVLSENRSQLRDALEQRRGDYVLVEGRVRALFDWEVNREAFPLMWQLIQWTASTDFELVKEFRPGDGLTGPTLALYRRASQ